MIGEASDKHYDAFITYRGGPDAAEANALYDILLRNQLVSPEHN